MAGVCDVQGCLRESRSRGWCNLHYRRWKAHGDPDTVGTAKLHTGPSHWRWQGDSANYRATHLRMRRANGKASLHQCVDCGKQAKHWSYDRLDPNERVESVEGRMMVFSVDIERYEPRCINCHLKLDHPDWNYS